jgi:two-component system, LuxR family, sensor kinase FixL
MFERRDSLAVFWFDGRIFRVKWMWSARVTHTIATLKSPMNTRQTTLIFSQQHRQAFLLIGVLGVVAIAFIDSLTPSLPLGYLYLIPILVMAGFLPRPWIAFLVLVCAGLTAALSRYQFRPAATLFVMACVGFAGTGFFISEVVRNRQKAIAHLREIRMEVERRQEVEEQLRGLVYTSPLAIITISSSGNILLANEAAQNLFSPEESSIVGQSISQFLPALHDVTHQLESRTFRTNMRCSGKRKNGESFMAAVWFSTSATELGPIISAIVIDFSEDLRDREDLSLDHLLKNAKILVGAISHEIRNLCGAVLSVYRYLSQFPEIRNNKDFHVLGTLVEGLENLAKMELRPAWFTDLSAVDLPSVFDELRAVIEPSCREVNVEIVWGLPHKLPLVIGDRYGLMQVFLNLIRNSIHAMEESDVKQLSIRSAIEANSLVLYFEDTGVGIADPAGLFKPFYQRGDASGLGLYVSKAILHSFRGEIEYRPRAQGCCFAVILAIFASSSRSISS